MTEAGFDLWSLSGRGKVSNSVPPLTRDFGTARRLTVHGLGGDVEVMAEPGLKPFAPLFNRI